MNYLLQRMSALERVADQNRTIFTRNLLAQLIIEELKHQVRKDIANDETRLNDEVTEMYKNPPIT